MKWQQDSCVVHCKYKNLVVYFRVPLDFDLSSTRPETIELLNLVLFSPFHKEMLDRDFPAHDLKSKRCGLAFSGGLDSTAAMMLLPKDTELCYMRRDFESLLKHDNADRFCEAIPKRVWSVRSNHEKIRTLHGERVGFSMDLSCMAHVILLADYLNVGRICTGIVLEDTYLRGCSFQSLSESSIIGVDPFCFNFWRMVFNSFGFDLCLPVYGLSEVVTSKIVNNSDYRDLASACLRSDGECMACYKCYRKNLLKQNPIKINNGTLKMMDIGRLSHLPSLLYGLSKCEITSGPIVKKYQKALTQNLDFLERYPDFYLHDAIDAELIDAIKNNLSLLGVEAMDKEDVNNIKSFKRY